MAKPALTLKPALLKSHQFSLHPREHSHQPDGKAWLKDSFKDDVIDTKAKAFWQERLLHIQGYEVVHQGGSIESKEGKGKT